MRLITIPSQGTPSLAEKLILEKNDEYSAAAKHTNMFIILRALSLDSVPE
jgi:hypothetical protein